MEQVGLRSVYFSFPPEFHRKEGVAKYNDSNLPVQGWSFGLPRCTNVVQTHGRDAALSMRLSEEDELAMGRAEQWEMGAR
jgi:hypothetical protein